MHAPVKPTYIFFLSRHESSVRMDTRTLRSMGITNIVHLTNSSSAESALLKHQQVLAESKRAGSVPYCIICDEQLDDMPAFNFLASITRHQHLCTLPVLLLTSSDEATKQMQKGGILALQRPYTQEQMSISLTRALAPNRPALQHDMLTKLLPPPSVKKLHQPSRVITTTDWYHKGLEAIAAHDLKEAERALYEVISRQENHIAAYLHLADVLVAREKTTDAHHILIEAAATCLRNNDQAYANLIIAKLPTAYQYGNLFIHEALMHLSHNNYKKAAFSFFDAARTSEGTPLAKIIARSCQFTPQPEENIRHLCTAYKRMGYRSIAKSLEQRLLLKSTVNLPNAEGWLDHFPRLRDAITVASYTTWVWKHA